MSLTRDQLFEALVKRGAVTSVVFEETEQSREAKEMGIAEALVARGAVTEKQLGQLLAWWYNVPYFDFGKEPIDKSVVNIVPEMFAREHGLIPVRQTEENITIVTSEPKDLLLRSLLEKYLRKKVRYTYSTRRDILDHLFLFQRDPQTSLNAILQRRKGVKRGKVDTTVIHLVDTILNLAYQMGASDVHIEPEERAVVVRFRTDGVLHDIAELPIEVHEAIITRLKVLSRLATDEHRKAQDGKITFETPWHNAVEIRLSILPTTHAEKAVMRLLTDKNRRFSLGDLGLGADDFKKVSDVIHQPWGMLLVTGPTGSGKSTSLYSVLKVLNDRDVNITTIEDPVEYDMEGVNQIQVDDKADLTFAKGLRSIVRQDPDIIMVGEIRDKETAGIAVNAAMTGHLVLSTLHTNDAATAFIRLTEMQVEDFLMASTVSAVVAQRLVRRVCMNCIQSTFLSEAELRLIEHLPEVKAQLIKISEKEDISKVRFYSGKGCHVCHNTGYKGRVGVFEVLMVTDAIRDAIMNHKNSDEIREIALKEGMTSMMSDGLGKALLGLTTIKEALRATRNVQQSDG